ncbi:MAG TPA: hypothetical protein VIQ53_02815 [Inquilinus sp.]
MLSDDIRSLARTLRECIDPATARLELEPRMVRLVLDQVDTIGVLAGYMERGVMPRAAQGDLPDGVVDLAAVRRRRQFATFIGGPAA